MRLLCAILLAGFSGRASAADAPLSPFGIGACHINGRSVADLERWVPDLQAIGITNCRSVASQWGSVEPKEGQWAWENLDKQIQYLSDRKIRCGALLQGSPSWNTLDAPGSLPVNNLAGWSKYARELATHLKGRVSDYEIWNEPPNGIGRNQTAADYAKIVVAAYDAIKAVDPTARVGLSAKSAHITFLEQTIAAGAKDHFDFITLHPYEVLNGIADNTGSESVYLHIVPTVRTMLAAKNPAKANVPIIFTELGSDSKKGAEHQAHALVKAYTMGIAQGVECIQWFEGRDGDSGPMGLIDGKGKPRPAYTAMGAMIAEFGHAPRYLGWLLLNERDYAFVFQGAKSTLLVTWAPKGKADRVDFGQAVEFLDPLTGSATTAQAFELTVAPIIVRNVPAALVATAKANRAKPIPWGGDYSNAETVSITFGETTKEEGLHTRSGSDVAAAVVAYGGSARAGNVPGGNVFIVDPNFLSYTATPIEITAVVRRNTANDNAGFKLVYEGPAGFKTAGGWHTIPDNKQWHTVKWTVNDPQFVNYWGYNFALESDGDKFNKYFLQSVSVRKLKK